MTLESQRASDDVMHLTDDVPAWKNTWSAGSLSSLGHQICLDGGGGCLGLEGRGGPHCILPKESSFDRLNYSPIKWKKEKGRGLKSCKWRRNTAARRGVGKEEGRVGGLSGGGGMKGSQRKDPSLAGRRSWQSCELEELKCKADNGEQAEMKTEHDVFEGRLGAGVGLKSPLICGDDFDAETFNWRGHESSSQQNTFHPLMDVVT